MSQPEKNGKKVLIIEDDDMLQLLLSNQLEGQGFQISTARDGEEGLKKILEERPDVVLLDIVMPKKDGITVLEELHKKEPANKTPILVLTNSNDMNHVALAMSHHASEYFVKADHDIQGIVAAVKRKAGLA